MLKKILVAGFMVAAKDMICCKHINWLFHYQPLLACLCALVFTEGIAVRFAKW